MVRSGWVRNRRRAGSPTMMLPSGSTLTMDGQRVEPYGPGIHFGWPVVASIYATRLFVVPRSIPTVRPMWKTAGAKAPALHKLLLNVGDQIPDVGAAIQQFVEPGHDFFSRRRIRSKRSVPVACCGLQLPVDFDELLLKIVSSGLETYSQGGQVAARFLSFAKLVERFVELENLFEKFRGSLLLFLAFLAFAFDAQEILDAADGISQGAIGVIQFGAALEGKFALHFRGVHKVVGMEFPAQLKELLFKAVHLYPQLFRHLEEGKIVERLRNLLQLAAGGTEMRAHGALMAVPADEGRIRGRWRGTHKMFFKKSPEGTRKVAGGCGCQPLVRLACVLPPPESNQRRRAQAKACAT